MTPIPKFPTLGIGANQKRLGLLSAAVALKEQVFPELYEQASA